ncbi:hypothetical protein [Microbacterium sp. Leaf159]|uniref:hypothetical protein n=1 Tax=Microbacterium sp. Leaf159 TaxID=1736279 RepID=UPI0006FF4186|nr:hypothetical protein [Microbacterium sp. Leaf159]KQR39854.1 hypothetical protein ASF80_10905 [Microbacterium sp. Leaf159]
MSRTSERLAEGSRRRTLGRSYAQAAIGGLVLGALAAGTVPAAYALWAMDDSVSIPAFDHGRVAFAAAPADGSAALVRSTDGAAVELVLPGSKMAEVLGQTGPDAAPIIWTFEATGWADGIVGLVYDVSVTSQVAIDGSVHDLSAGMAQEGTLLRHSTLKVYPADAGGGCTAVPATPDSSDGETHKNIMVFDGQEHRLQASGAWSDGGSSQTWCAAMAFINAPDGSYVNDAFAQGTAEDGKVYGALDTWNTTVGFPPSLPLLGTYVNDAEATGVAEDQTRPRDVDVWSAALYPDPSSEPDITIVLDPAATNLNAAVTQPSDHFATTISNE